MLEDFIRSHAERQGDKVAIACKSETVTYSQLLEAMAKAQPNKVVRASNSIEFLVEYFAAHVSGIPFAPLEKDISAERFAEIESLVNHASIPEDVADILFTTGTTGLPKGAMISHETIIANAENLVEAQRFTPSTTSIISGPLNHIGSLSKVWPTIMVGGTIVITEGIKDIDSFFKAFDFASGKIATFLVPASIHILMQLAPERLASYASKIDFIETGAAPMTQDDMEKLCSLLPNSRLYNTYASTETGIIATHNYNAPGATIAGCLGKPMKHSAIVIGDDGRITCKGKTLMAGYLDNNSSLPISHSSLETNDLGHIDEQGRLRLDGRLDDMINVGGYKVSPVEVENAALRSPLIADCICVSAAHPIMGNVLKLIFVAQKPIKKSEIALHLKNNLESYKVPLLYEQVDKIERTFNGKLNRKFYKPLQ